MADQSEKKGERPPVRPWQGINPFDTMRDVMNRVVDTFFEPLAKSVPPQFRPPAPGFRPSVEVIEEDEDVRVNVEVPGMRPEDLSVTVTEASVVVRGEKKAEELAGKGVHKSERSYGAFRRVIPLPVQVDKDGVDAVFKNGVLTITLPKCQEAVRKVQIRSEEG